MLDQLGFASAVNVRGRMSIADLFKSGQRCGIYVLHFANGEYYVGQALDITRRYVQHCKTHQDIEMIAFKRVVRKRLTDEERSIIGFVERGGWPLRNITFSSIPKGDTDFDLVMPPEDQERWLNDLRWIDDGGSRLIDPGLRRKYSMKFGRFVSMPHANDVIDVLRMYIQLGVPAIRRGEVSFWACSCLAGTSLYARVNVNWQEVLYASASRGVLGFTIYLARSPLERSFGPSMRSLLQRYPDIEHTNLYHDPGGSDQTSFAVPASTMQAFIRDPQILPAIRLLNMRLMKKGPCTYGRYHCLDLADRLIEQREQREREIVPREAARRERISARTYHMPMWNIGSLHMHRIPAEAYEYGLTAIRDRMHAKHYAMLRAQYEAPERTMTAPQLAMAVGYTDFRVVNAQYGRLGHLLAEAMRQWPDKDRSGRYMWWSVLSSGASSDEGFRWTMRLALAYALETLGIVDSSE